MKAYNQEAGFVIYFRPRCKLWSCPACAEINRGLWAVRAHQGAHHFLQSGGTIYFLTLTSHENLNAYTSLKVWPKAWKKLHARATRHGGKQSYMMVPERHQDGRLHMHAITTWPMDDNFWKDNGRECGLGFIAESDEARTPGGCAHYVTKYISKSLADTTWPKGWRRVRTSRDWPPLPQLPPPPGWRFSVLEKADGLADEVTRHEQWGERVFVLDHRAAWEAIATIDADGVALPQV